MLHEYVYAVSWRNTLRAERWVERRGKNSININIRNLIPHFAAASFSKASSQAKEMKVMAAPFVKEEVEKERMNMLMIGAVFMALPSPPFDFHFEPF